MKPFKKLFSALNQKKVKYMVAGGIAVNLYGIERATADVDIIIKLVDANLRNFIDAVKGLGLKPKIPVRLEDFLDVEVGDDMIRLSVFRRSEIEQGVLHCELTLYPCLTNMRRKT